MTHISKCYPGFIVTNPPNVPKNNLHLAVGSGPCEQVLV